MIYLRASFRRETVNSLGDAQPLIEFVKILLCDGERTAVTSPIQLSGY